MLALMYLLGFLTGAAAAALVLYIRSRRAASSAKGDELAQLLSY